MIFDISIILIFFLLRLPFPKVIDSLSTIDPLLFRSISDLVIIVCILSILKIKSSLHNSLLGWRFPSLQDILRGLLYAIVLLAISLTVLNISKKAPFYEYFSIQLYRIYLVLFITSFTEELFFRGFLLKKLLSSSMAIIYALIINGLLFGFSHLYSGMGATIFSIISGIILGYVVTKYKSLGVGVVAHFVYNALAYTLFIMG